MNSGSATNSGSEGGSTTPDTATDSFDPKGNIKPTDAQTVQEITDWLTNHNINVNGKTKKADLLALVPAN